MRILINLLCVPGLQSKFDYDHYSIFSCQYNGGLTEKETINVINVDAFYYEFLSCFFKHYIGYDFSDFQNNLVMNNDGSAQLELKSSTTIPSILHYIWFGSNSRIYPFCRQVNENINKKFYYTIILWVNKIENYQEQVLFCLNQRIQIKEISEVFENSSEMLQFNILLKAINYFIKIGRYISSAEIARILVIYAYGGTVFNGCYKFINNPNLLNQIFDFYASGYTIGQGYNAINGGYCACKPKHIIIEQSLIYLKDNFSEISDLNPKQLKYREYLETIFQLTLLINFATNGNKDSNIDGIFPLTFLRVGNFQIKFTFIINCNIEPSLLISQIN